MSLDTYAICRTCQQILSLDKYLYYRYTKEDETYYRIFEKSLALDAWQQKHLGHATLLVDEHDTVMDECHHGWEYEEWDTGEKRICIIPERFRLSKPITPGEE